MANTDNKIMNIFNISNLNKKRLLFVVFAFLIVILSVTAIFVAHGEDGLTPTTPKKIEVIDNAKSDSNNTAWFTGYTNNSIEDVIIDRYSSYNLDVNTIKNKLGEKDYPYIIENGLEMANLATLVNNGNKFTDKYIRVTGSKKDNSQQNNVVDLISTGGILYSNNTTINWVPCDFNNNNQYGWNPIGDSETNYFDGNIYADDNVEIYNLSANLKSQTNFGLFGYLGANATINNFNLVDTQIYCANKSKNVYIGSLVGTTNGGKITNCSVKSLAFGKRTSTGNNSKIQTTDDKDYYIVPDFMMYNCGEDGSIGGIVGKANGKTTIDNCNVNGTLLIDNGSGVGNVIGTISNSTQFDVDIQNITGNCLIKSKNYMYGVGGVVGKITNTKANVSISKIGTKDEEYTVNFDGKSKCAKGNDTAHYGGFAGVVGYNETTSLSIEDSYLSIDANLPKEDLNNNNYYFGGILGRNQTATNDSNKLFINNCNVNNLKLYSLGDTTTGIRLSAGGIIGGCNNLVKNSTVSNCKVKNAQMSIDGLAGGIIGLGYSGNFAYINNVTKCNADNVSFYQDCSVKDSKVPDYFVFGGICAGINANTNVDNCNANNFSINYVTKTKEASIYIIGGIVGRANGGTVNNCTSKFVSNLGIGETKTLVSIGGIIGTSYGVSVSNCCSLINTNPITKVVNNVGVKDGYTAKETTLESTYKDSNGNIKTTSQQNMSCGGIIGYAVADSKSTVKKVSIQNCFASGDINAEKMEGFNIGNRQSTIGGLIGSSNCVLNVNNCFSTVSLSANMQDAVGGLVGYNSDSNLKVENYYYGGALLNSYDASISKYSNGGTYTNIYVNSKYAPNSPTASTGYYNISGVQNITNVPESIAEATKKINPTYYTIATKPYENFSGDHVFAVNDDLGNDNYEVKTEEFSEDAVTITKRIKLVKNLINENQDGTNNEFTISSNDDLENMQKYVAVGGGFLGCKYKLTDDFDCNVILPIGSCDSEFKNADIDNQPFCGIFNGDNHAITYTAIQKLNSSKTNIYNGLFGYVLNSTISNVNINYKNNNKKTNYIKSSKASGGLVGCAAYSSIDGVSVNATDEKNEDAKLSEKGNLFLDSSTSGGICGNAISTIFNTNSKNKPLCFNGLVTTTSYNFGGMCGSTADDKPTFRLSEAGATGVDEMYSLISFSYGGAHSTLLKNCYVSGDVLSCNGTVAHTDKANISSKIGGLIGYSSCDWSLIDSCFVYGNVSGGVNVGGLIGYQESLVKGTNTYDYALINNSYFHGDVYGNDKVGGIIGYINKSDYQLSGVTNTYFVGQIQCDDLFGALSSSKVNYTNFTYDRKVCGDISVYPGKEDDEFVELDTTDMLKSVKTSSNYISAKDIVKSDSDINTLNKEPYTVNGSTVTFYSKPNKWEYKTSSKTYNDSQDRLITTYDDNRVAVQNSDSGENINNTMTITFTGNYIDLYFIASSGGDCYQLSIDNKIIDNSKATSSFYSSTISTYSQVLRDKDNVDITKVDCLSKTDLNSNYAIAISKDFGFTDNAVVKGASISNLSNGEHTIVLTGYSTKSNSYMNIRGYSYGTTSTVIDENSRYNTIGFFENNCSDVSKLSTKASYNFFDENEKAITCRNCYVNSGVKVNSDSYDDDLGITHKGIEKDTDNKKYTISSEIENGQTFTITTTDNVNNYDLKIAEKIVAVPFQNGKGTKEEPYGIINNYQLVAFKNFINEVYNGAGIYFKLTMTTTTDSHSADGNIYDLTGEDESNSNTYLKVDNWESIGTKNSKFQGNLNGNGKTISGINLTYNDDCAGLFGYCTNAKIDNLTVQGTGNITLPTDLGTNKTAVNIGILAGKLDSCDVSNSTVKNSTINIKNNNNTLKNYLNVGLAFGSAFNNCNLSNMISYGSITTNNDINANNSDNVYINIDTESSFDNSSYFSVGGIVGMSNESDGNSILTMTNSISKCEIVNTLTSLEYKDGIYTPFLCINVGGAIGNLIGTDKTTVELENVSTFGNYSNNYGKLGGIIGGCVNKYSWTSGRILTMNNCVSTANLQYGNSNYTGWTKEFHVGGLLGDVNIPTNNVDISNSIYGGTINLAQTLNNKKLNMYVGGIVGRTSNSSNKSQNTYYDLTKNPDIPLCGDNDPFDTYNRTITSTGESACYGKSSAQLTTNGKYNYEFTDKFRFTNDVQKDIANKIIDSNMILLGVVRTDHAISLYSSDSKLNELYNHNEPYDFTQLTTTFVTSKSGASLQVTDENSNSIATASSNRIISTNDTVVDKSMKTITVKVVKIVDGKDEYDGFGQSITYLPSTKNIGKSDSSAFIADENGDGLNNNTVDKSFVVYRADQFMGIDSVVNNNGEDGFGNPVPTDFANYTVYLNNDIDFANIDYTNHKSGNDVTTMTTTIGGSEHSFADVLDGNEHTIYGISSNNENSCGIFSNINGGTIQNIGVTDSVFALTSTSGNIGTFAGVSQNANYNNVFSSARVEIAKDTNNTTYVGGINGESNNDNYTNCYFTGSVGKTASSNDVYPKIGTGFRYFAGGFSGIINGAVNYDNCYVASYIDGNVTINDDGNTYKQNMGFFAGENSNSSKVQFNKCKVNNNSSSENCNVIGGENIVLDVLSANDGLYPSVFNKNNQSAREIASRICAVFSTSASSMSRLDIKVGELSKDNYLTALTVYGGNKPLYDLDQKFATRTNSGLASILVKYTDDKTNITSYRMIMMNLQCWYDNFTESDGKKTYYLKNFEDLIELAQMVKDGSDENVGHTHSVAHTGKGIAEDRFDTATIKLGNNLIANGQLIDMIGLTKETAFAGSFDGNGYTIINPSLQSKNNMVGMFGHISDNSTISNVMFTGDINVNIDKSCDSTVYGGTTIANYEAGKVENCMNGGNINITNNSNENVVFGGIVGKIADNKTLQYCYNMGKITTQTDGIKIAGIAGENNGTIKLCYNTGMIQGYTILDDPNYVQKTTVAGICANNKSTISNCYNSAILSYFGKNKMNAIAINSSDGSINNSYVNGQFLSADYSYKATTTGYNYCDGVTTISADMMSSGKALSGFDSSSQWAFVKGYYPQFYNNVYSDTVNGSQKVASSVSSLATTLTGSSSQLVTFGDFQTIRFNYGDKVFDINQLEGTLAQFTRSYTYDALKMSVTKRGAATIFINRNSAGVLFSRENYFINEDTFSVRYMFDFSQLTNNSEEASYRTNEIENKNQDTFADSSTRKGTGTSGNPYLINTAKDLLEFSKYIKKSSTGGEGRNFKLVRNIDCSSISWQPIGDNEHPFKGNFNGNGYTISGIKCSNYTYCGLFGYIGENAVVTLISIKDSIFTAKPALSVNISTEKNTFTGAIAGYCDGTISNCYSRAVVTIPTSINDSTKDVYYGGLVGSLDKNGLIQACYMRPAKQESNNNNFVPDGSNNIINYSSYKNMYGGIIAGNISGTIDGCYHTAVYYTPTGYDNTTQYGIIGGIVDNGTIKNVYYDTDLIPSTNRNIFLNFNDEGSVISESNNIYGKTTQQLQQKESSATTNGIANDSMALQLSSNIYLGAFEMDKLASDYDSTYSNDGFPMLMSFDVLQYKFKSFDTANFVLFLQNIDASSPKLMNALCSIDNYDFPIYADLIAKEKLNVDVVSLPKNLNFNVSAVGYGVDEDGEIKWTAINGQYTSSRELDKDITIITETENDDGETVTDEKVIKGHGNGMIDRTSSYGSMAIPMNKTELLPINCNKVYVYITLLPKDNTNNNTWGVRHIWSSSTLNELPEDELLDDD